jgi:5-methyltetrahydrofolate--homocysteine methyltransferase
VTQLIAPNGTLEFGPGLPTVLINDQLRVMDQSPEVLAELKRGCLDKLLDLARWGHAVGTDMVDILINHPDLDEAALLPQVAAAVQAEIGCPIALDSRHPAALEAALEALCPHKALINSITAETESIESLMPLARRYGAAVVGMPIGHLHGLPKTVAGRLEELSVFLSAAEKHGIPREDIVIDTLCLASSAEPGSMRVTLETTQAVNAMGLATVLGIGNAGFGMPEPTRIDLAYLSAAIHWGLNAALVNPATDGLIPTVRAADFLCGNDPVGRRYIQHYRAQRQRTAGSKP